MQKQRRSSQETIVMTNLESRGTILLTKVYTVKVMFFSSSHGCESWTIKKAEH